MEMSSLSIYKDVHGLVCLDFSGERLKLRGFRGFIFEKFSGMQKFCKDGTVGPWDARFLGNEKSRAAHNHKFSTMCSKF